MGTTGLGTYLRARRAQVTPEQAGLPTYGVRRVPGLRREEVATTAGMSVDYYVRLEQGRERSPSAQVLDALSQVLQLDADARAHLYRLAGLTPAAARITIPERVDPQLLRLMDMWPDNPALVLGRAYDVLAGNSVAHALFDGLDRGPNLMLMMFQDPAARSLYLDWEWVAGHTVAGFRALQSRWPQDPRVSAIIDELTDTSPEFLAMWERHEARPKRLTTKRFRHPAVGDLTLQLQAFDVRSAPGQELVVYHAEPGTSDAHALALIGTLAATCAEERARP
jgi:transcriptional regulator with XRE-family HTH domain